MAVLFRKTLLLQYFISIFFPREMGGRGRHLSVSAQFQWSFASLCCLHKFICFSPQENLGQDWENGKKFFFLMIPISLKFHVDFWDD